MSKTDNERERERERASELEMKVGEKGKKYGLSVPAVRLGLGRGKAALGRKKAAVLKPSLGIFANDDEDEGEGEGVENTAVRAQIAAQQRYAHSIAKNEDVYKEALAQDPTVFEYDEVYDGFHSGEKKQAKEDKLNRESKYIADLKAKAAEREREQDMAYERRMAKDAQKEDELHGKDTEKFITSSYRKKLEEERKWVEREKLRDEEEKRNDVTKKKNLGDFYKNLLTNNVSFGAKAEPSHTEAEKKEGEVPTGEAEGKRKERSKTSEPESERPNRDKADALSAGAQSRSRKQLEETSGPAGKVKQRDAAAGKREPFILAATFRAAKDGYVYKQGPLGLGYYLDEPIDFTKIQGTKIQGDGQQEQGPVVAQKDLSQKSKKRNREEIVNAARQRYLERKQHKATK